VSYTLGCQWLPRSYALDKNIKGLFEMKVEISSHALEFLHYALENTLANALSNTLEDNRFDTMLWCFSYFAECLILWVANGFRDHMLWTKTLRVYLK
nr:hypothetical protein [Tanacetum cinerariifolium]